MPKIGIYQCRQTDCGHDVGKITIRVKETAKSFILELLGNTVRYDAPQIDDMFRESKTVSIKKTGSKHAMTFCGDDWFCLYPYRVGAPYAFDYVGEDDE